MFELIQQTEKLLAESEQILEDLQTIEELLAELAQSGDYLLD